MKIVGGEKYVFPSKLWSHFKKAGVSARYLRYPVMSGFLFSGWLLPALTEFSGSIVVNMKKV